MPRRYRRRENFASRPRYNVAMCALFRKYIYSRAPVICAPAFAFALCAAVSHAGGGLPADVCYDGCGANQQRIWNRFENAAGVNVDALPKVYAGVCYVLGAGINNEREHHVGFLFDQVGGMRALHMRFSFFTPAQPYDEFDAADARAHFGAPALPLSAHDGYVYAEADSRHFLAKYWFRGERESGRVLLVSYFGARVIILCDAGENG